MLAIGRCRCLAVTALFAGAQVGAGTAKPEVLSAPVAKQVPHVVSAPYGDRQDPYYWLRDDSRQSKDVLDHLKAENRFARAALDHLRPAMGELFIEMRKRIKEDDCNVPYEKSGYWYQSCFRIGQQHPVHLRRAGSPNARAQVLLDVNSLAAGHAYFALGSMAVSPNGRQLAWTEDRVGQRRYHLRVKDIASGVISSDVLSDVEPSIAWSNDNRSLLYIAKDARTLLGNKVMRHQVGAPAAASVLVYAEADPSYYLRVGRSRSDRFLFIGASSSDASEWRYADAADPALAFKPVYPRESGHEYEVQDHGDEFVILSNWQADNFRALRVPIAHSHDRRQWREWLAHDPKRLLESMTVMNDAVVFAERADALRKLRVKRWIDGQESTIAFPDTSYVALAGSNPEFAKRQFRLVYSSLNTPNSTYDYDFASGKLKLLKREPVLGRFRPSNYVSELIFVPARDGARIPVSLLYRKRVGARVKAPLYISGYGAYGNSSDPYFNQARLSLADRGMLIAIAHVRGGEEMGRAWYADGRRFNKKNSFHDFIDVTDFLVKEGWADPARVIAQGGSAGGLLMGAVANMAPDRYRAMIADVPFVDVVTSMLDANLPLTSNEYGEWGNPELQADYQYMLSYSPYDNVRKQAYPTLLVSAGLFDSQVPYWEPAKWVARLRAADQSASPVILLTNLSGGHRGHSGRFGRLKQIALSYAFVLDQAGLRVHTTKKRHVDWPKKIVDADFIIKY